MVKTIHISDIEDVAVLGKFEYGNSVSMAKFCVRLKGKTNPLVCLLFLGEENKNLLIDTKLNTLFLEDDVGTVNNLGFVVHLKTFL